MIVPSMTFAEIRREIKRDMPFVNRKIEQQAYFISREKCHRLAKVNIHARDFYSPNKNTWILTHFVTKRGWKSWSAVYYFGEKGLTLVSNLTLHGHLLVCTGHFFKRYNERMNLQLPTPEIIMKHYCMENQEFIFRESPAFKSEKINIFSLLPSGIALGVKNEQEKLIFFNTFITHDMLNKKQEAVVDELRKSAALDKSIKELKSLFQEI